MGFNKRKMGAQRAAAARGRTLGIILLPHRIAEQRRQPVAELLGDMAAHFRDRRRGGVEIGAARSRHSSASSLAPIPVEPTRSQNITVAGIGFCLPDSTGHARKTGRIFQENREGMSTKAAITERN
jgi:hypothetical protein